MDVNNAILDSDYLFESLMNEYPADTPDGKARISMAFFQYVDSLQTDIQKETSLEQLCQKLNLSSQAVLRDYNNRESARSRLEKRTDLQNSETEENIRKGMELRVLLAVIADTNQFELMRREINEDVFESSEAKQLFIILEDCYQQKKLSFSSICEHCKDPKLTRLITEGVMSGEYSQNTEKIIRDGIEIIKEKNLKRQMDYIIERLKTLKNPSTPEQIQEFNSLMKEKMNIDRLVCSKKN